MNCYVLLWILGYCHSRANCSDTSIIVLSNVVMTTEVFSFVWACSECSAGADGFHSGAIRENDNFVLGRQEGYERLDVSCL